ncbi:acyltransferase-domain-containing protein [Fimicolochytrium jonesii]|uniref:acyltransferase-domain-containing protein n=1 Tax=Fimicolochytrium jonesii TaxID=1396493 RepID=UPI0022FE6E65|nr:acyltransferase-domain-containing protein [Fimicolochytrium jonesii]KAI8816596.1 acyltransferase-domain-containing protein [Fimicolochytrium jonesii]
MDSASASINLLQFPGLILHPISRRVYRQYMQWTQKLFGELIVLLTWVFTGRVEIVVTGEWEALSEERGGAIPEMKVIMANHQIYSDWWWLWIVAWSCGAHGSLKIILKKSLKYFPVFGWGMQFFEFIFLARKWSLDKSTLSTILHRASRDALPLWLVIFPEGTVITDDTKSKSRAYAKKMDLPDDPQHVLIPKSTGLFFCLRNLQPGCEYLYDVTIGYEGLTASQTPYEVYSLSRVFFEARGPERVHVHVERVRVAGLPGFEKADGEITEVEEEEQAKRFGEWLRKRFLRKDRLMSAFYRDGRFGGDDVDEPTTNANAAASSHTAASPDHTTSAGLTPTHTSQQPKLRDHRQHIIKPRPRATDFLALLATLTAGFLAARALWGWWI